MAKSDGQDWVLMLDRKKNLKKLTIATYEKSMAINRAPATIDPQLAIGTVVYRLNLPGKNVLSRREAKQLGMDQTTLRSMPLMGDDFVRMALRLVNCTPYETLRMGTNAMLGFDPSVDWSALLKDAYFNELMGIFHEAPASIGSTRRDIGMALHTLRENAQIHIWNGRAYCQALRNPAFVSHAYACERWYSRRESKWYALIKADAKVQAHSQAKFAKQMVEISGYGAGIPAPDDHDDAWIDYVYQVATFAGHDMIRRIGFDPLKETDMYNAYLCAATKTTVGQPVPSIIRAYLAVANAIPSDPTSVSKRISLAWGMSCFYDVFFLSRNRYDMKHQQVQALLIEDYLQDIKAAFAPLRTSTPQTRAMVETAVDAAPSLVPLSIEERQNALIEGERMEHERATRKQDKRRAKKNRRRQIRKQQSSEMNNLFTEAAERASESVEESGEDPNVEAPDAPSDVPAIEADHEALGKEDDRWSIAATCGDEEMDASDTSDAGATAESQLPEGRPTEEEDRFASTLCRNIVDLFGPDCPIPPHCSLIELR